MDHPHQALKEIKSLSSPEGAQELFFTCMTAFSDSRQLLLILYRTTEEQD